MWDKAKSLKNLLFARNSGASNIREELEDTMIYRLFETLKYGTRVMGFHG
jgi:hypothetical protein